MALAELLEKAGEGDFLRAVAEMVLQLLMEADVDGVIGAGRYERSGERTTWRNGFRERVWIPAWDRCSYASRNCAKAAISRPPRGPEGLGEGAGRGHPGGLDWRRLDPAGR